MCDTILAPPAGTAAGVMLFGKNSDRQRNEAQSVEFFPGASHKPGAALECTYITIPQVSRTHALLLCRPFWTWGAEMGANEHGVVIGNEGLHARSTAPEAKALLGMDLLRLALERAASAAEAVEVITTLLARHGQGGNGGHLTPAYYNNGYMIADSEAAFVLETVGREWVLERVKGVRAISNRYSIAADVERVSAGLPALIRESGWGDTGAVGYADVIANPDREHIGNAGARRATSTAILRSREGRLDVADMMSILRDHGSGDGRHPQWRNECARVRTLCMHAGAVDRIGQTVGSMVSELADRHTVHWVTGTAAPCIGIFKPVLMDAPLPFHGPALTDRFDPSTLWWRHERLHRSAILGDFGKLLERIRPERDALEDHFRERIGAVLNGGSAADRARVVAECWRTAMAMEASWHEHIDRSRVEGVDAACTSAWQQMNQLAGVEFSTAPLEQPSES